MTTRALFLEVDHDIIPNISGVSSRTVAAAPPSTADLVSDEMRVRIGERTIIYRPFDPGTPIATTPSEPYAAKDGTAYVTKDDVPYVTKVQS